MLIPLTSFPVLEQTVLTARATPIRSYPEEQEARSH